MRPLALLAAVAALAAAGCGGGSTTTVTVTRTVERTKTVTAPGAPTTTAAAAAACPASALTGTFSVVEGSAGAGQITYRLRLTNQGDSACSLSGLPDAQLLGRDGARLPTNVSPAQPGATTAAKLALQPGDAARADARFSPDVPGESEQTAGACEPKAYTLRVSIGSGSVDAAVEPPTPVCERGTLLFSVFTAA